MIVFDIIKFHWKYIKLMLVFDIIKNFICNKIDYSFYFNAGNKINDRF